MSKGSISKKKNPMPEKGTRKMRKKKIEGKRPFKRPRNICEDNIQMDHNETGWELSV
jgi:hypothetical protein